MNVLPLTYLGNIQYFSKLCFSDCMIDINENYVKQSYRTRCDILAANGPASLTINVMKGSNWNKLKVKDVRIDYSKRWQHNHWQAIVSAYMNSPFFEHYAQEFEPFYTKQYDFLLDFNVGLTETVLKLLASDVSLKFSENYIEPCLAQAAKINTTNSSCYLSDWREAISPKPRLYRPDAEFTPIPYWQVFSDRMNFVPNLSVIDLLFCEGPSALTIIKECISR